LLIDDADIHPLALEDILHQPRSGLLSKVDYYSKHLFLRVLCHTLSKSTHHDHEPLLYSNPITNHSYTNVADAVTGLPRSASPVHYDEKGGSDPTVAYSSGLKHRFSASKQRSDVLPQYSEKPTPPRKTPDISSVGVRVYREGVMMLNNHVDPEE
jgi:hypothetical protein